MVSLHLTSVRECTLAPDVLNPETPELASRACARVYILLFRAINPRFCIVDILALLLDRCKRSIIHMYHQALGDSIDDLHTYRMGDNIKYSI